jgi:hypothetical protein
MKRHLLGILLAWSLWTYPAAAFDIESAITNDCHEYFTYQAILQLETKPGMPATITEEDEILAGGIQYNRNGDYPNDRLTISLLLGARHNDLHGLSSVAIDDLTKVHNEPQYQQEHCLRKEYQDGNSGAESAVEDSRRFITQMVEHAFDGQDQPDPWLLEEVNIFLRFRGPTKVPLSRLYFYLGRAVHTVQDSFSHTLRSKDGRQITEVCNWIDLLNNTLDQRRDGYPHQSITDNCHCQSLIYDRLIADTQQASLDFLDAVLGAVDIEERQMRLNQFFDKWMQFKSDCTLENNYCSSELLPELNNNAIQCPSNTGCGCEHNPSHQGSYGFWGVMLLVILVLVRKRLTCLVAFLLLVPTIVFGHDQTESIVCTDPPSEPGVYMILRTGISTAQPALSFEGSGLVRGDTWGFGLAVDFNPFLSFERGIEASSGTLNIIPSVTLHFQLTQRLAMRFEGRLGLSILLFDTVGYDYGSLGLFLGIRAVGLDYRLAKNMYLTIDPLEVALPVFGLDKVPYYWRQIRAGAGLAWRF